MFAPKRVSPSALQTVGLSLACTILLTSAAAVPCFAQVGPLPPQPKNQQVNPVAKKLVNFLKKGSSSDKTDAADKSADGNGDADDSQAPDLSTTTTKQPREKTPSLEEMQVKHPPLLSQPPLTTAKIEEPQIDSANPPVLTHPKLDDPNNPLGFTDAENRLKRLAALVDQHRYSEARPGLVQLRQSLVDLTEAHIGLFKTLNQVPSARGQAELEKELALEFAQLRDRTMVEMAKVYISEKDYPHAVKELTEVVKSQPRSKVGLDSYGLLQEIGFTEKLQLAQ